MTRDHYFLIIGFAIAGALATLANYSADIAIFILSLG